MAGAMLSMREFKEEARRSREMLTLQKINPSEKLEEYDDESDGESSSSSSSSSSSESSSDEEGPEEGAKEFALKKIVSEVFGADKPSSPTSARSPRSPRST